MGEKNQLVEAISNVPDKDWTKDIKLVREITAKNCSDSEFSLLCYQAVSHGLNPLNKEIWAVKYEGKPALIFVGRDGLLSIAHRTVDKKGNPVFGGMETTFEFAQPDPKATFTIKTDVTKPVSATCTIYRKDFDKPFKTTVYFDEYNLKQALWLSKPKTMLGKVAEAQTLRKAFAIHGLLTPDEMPPEQEDKKPVGKVIDIEPAKEE